MNGWNKQLHIWVNGHSSGELGAIKFIAIANGCDFPGDQALLLVLFLFDLGQCLQTLAPLFPLLIIQLELGASFTVEFLIIGDHLEFGSDIFMNFEDVFLEQRLLHWLLPAVAVQFRNFLVAEFRGRRVRFEIPLMELTPDRREFIHH